MKKEDEKSDILSMQILACLTDILIAENIDGVAVSLIRNNETFHCSGFSHEMDRFNKEEKDKLLIRALKNHIKRIEAQYNNEGNMANA